MQFSQVQRFGTSLLLAAASESAESTQDEAGAAHAKADASDWTGHEQPSKAPHSLLPVSIQKHSFSSHNQQLPPSGPASWVPQGLKCPDSRIPAFSSVPSATLASLEASLTSSGHYPARCHNNNLNQNIITQNNDAVCSGWRRRGDAKGGFRQETNAENDNPNIDSMQQVDPVSFHFRSGDNSPAPRFVNENKHDNTHDAFSRGDHINSLQTYSPLRVDNYNHNNVNDQNAKVPVGNVEHHIPPQPNYPSSQSKYNRLPIHVRDDIKTRLEPPPNQQHPPVLDTNSLIAALSALLSSTQTQQQEVTMAASQYVLGAAPTQSLTQLPLQLSLTQQEVGNSAPVVAPKPKRSRAKPPPKAAAGTIVCMQSTSGPPDPSSEKDKDFVTSRTAKETIGKLPCTAGSKKKPTPDWFSIKTKDSAGQMGEARSKDNNGKDGQLSAIEIQRFLAVYVKRNSLISEGAYAEDSCVERKPVEMLGYLLSSSSTNPSASTATLVHQLLIASEDISIIGKVHPLTPSQLEHLSKQFPACERLLGMLQDDLAHRMGKVTSLKVATSPESAKGIQRLPTPLMSQHSAIMPHVITCEYVAVQVLNAIAPLVTGIGAGSSDLSLTNLLSPILITATELLCSCVFLSINHGLTKPQQRTASCSSFSLAAAAMAEAVLAALTPDQPKTEDSTKCASSTTLLDVLSLFLVGAASASQCSKEFYIAKDIAAAQAAPINSKEEKDPLASLSEPIPIGMAERWVAISSVTVSGARSAWGKFQKSEIADTSTFCSHTIRDKNIRAEANQLEKNSSEEPKRVDVLYNPDAVAAVSALMLSLVIDCRRRCLKRRVAYQDVRYTAADGIVPSTRECAQVMTAFLLEDSLQALASILEPYYT